MQRNMPIFLLFCLPLPVAAQPAEPPPAAASAPAAGPDASLPAQPPAAQAAEPPATAGYSGNETFFLQSADGNFVLFPGGRIQVDGLFFPDRGAAAPRDTVGIRRVRPELQGSLFRRFDFQIGGDFAASAMPSATDAWVAWSPHALFNLQAGQTDIPFTNENTTSDKYVDFVERSLAVRAFAIPENKGPGLRAWGMSAERDWAYALMVLNGDGQNAANRDDSFDVAGRAWVQPLRLRGLGGPLSRVQVGASFYRGSHRRVGYAIPALKTQGGFTFADTSANGGKLVLAPEGNDTRWAVELVVPLGRFELQAEWVWVDKGASVQNVPGFSEPVPANRGRFGGSGGYVSAGFWVFGDRSIVGTNGVQAPPRLNLARPPNEASGLEIVAKAEWVMLDVSLPSPSPFNGEYGIGALQAGANVWMTKRVRLSAQYAAYFLDGRSALPAPGRTVEHELLLRAAVAL